MPGDSAFSTLAPVRTFSEYDNIHSSESIGWSIRLDASQRLKERANEAAALGNLASAYNDFGKHRRAIEFGEQALAISREIGDRAGEGIALCNLGNSHLELGDAKRAIEYLEQALAIGRETGDLRSEASVLVTWASFTETRRDCP